MSKMKLLKRGYQEYVVSQGWKVLPNVEQCVSLLGETSLHILPIRLISKQLGYKRVRRYALKIREIREVRAV